MMTPDIFCDALRAAKRGDSPAHRVGAAAYDRRGNLLGLGWNHLSSRRLCATPKSTHAEHHLISRLAREKTLDTADKIVVACLTQGGRTTMAKPCSACAALIDKHNLNVVYTEWCNVI
jgi:cytidine deaminase